MRLIASLADLDSVADPGESLCFPAAAAHARTAGPIGWRCNGCLRDFTLENIDANGRCPKCTARAVALGVSPSAEHRRAVALDTASRLLVAAHGALADLGTKEGDTALCTMAGKVWDLIDDVEDAL